MDGPGGVASAADGVIAAAEVLRLALDDAVARTGGLGALVHVRGAAGSQDLYLAASSGLSATFADKWQQVPLDAAAAPAAAARLDRPAGSGAQGAGPGMASVPLPSSQGEPGGALTVVMPALEPAAGNGTAW